MSLLNFLNATFSWASTVLCYFIVTTTIRQATIMVAILLMSNWIERLYREANQATPLARSLNATQSLLS